MYLLRLYCGEPLYETIGCIGTPGLCIFGWSPAPRFYGQRLKIDLNFKLKIDLNFKLKIDLNFKLKRLKKSLFEEFCWIK